MKKIKIESHQTLLQNSSPNSKQTIIIKSISLLKHPQKKMLTRSQTLANREANKCIELYYANVKAKNESAKKTATTATTATTEIKTPPKQPETKTEPQAPIKNPRTEEQYSNTPKGGYRTRLSTGAIERKTHTTTVDLSIEFDEVFFDEASKAWNKNKKKLGNGMYMYITRSSSKK